MARKLIAYSLVVLLGVLTSCASEKKDCDLSASNSPAVRGLRLGMTVDEVKAKFSASRMPDPDKFGVISMGDDDNGGSVLSYDDTKNNPDFQDAEISKLKFVDGRLADFAVVYSSYATKWDDPDQFIRKTSETFKLPYRAFKPNIQTELREQGYDWLTYDFRERRYKENPLMDYQSPYREYLLCDGVVVGAGFWSFYQDSTDLKKYGHPFISVTDLAAMRRAEDRKRDEKREEDRKREEGREKFNP
jgi:hypothetical protein